MKFGSTTTSLVLIALTAFWVGGLCPDGRTEPSRDGAASGGSLRSEPGEPAAAEAEAEAPLAAGRRKLEAGSLVEALTDLEEAVDDEPGNCAARLALGQTYRKLGDHENACRQLRAAIRVGKGSDNARKANEELLSMPASYVRPKTGPETREFAQEHGFCRRGCQETEPSRPAVLDFYATWCQPCQQLDQLLTSARETYGDRVNFVRIDVDDPVNERIADQYGISPIPTVIFLNSDGEVVSYTIGFAGEKALSAGLEKILQKG